MPTYWSVLDVGDGVPQNIGQFVRFENSGWRAEDEAATPVTWGAAIEVPLNRSYRAFGIVASIASPGAATSTNAPKFEKIARSPFAFSAATATTGSYAAGKGATSRAFVAGGRHDQHPGVPRLRDGVLRAHGSCRFGPNSR